MGLRGIAPEEFPMVAKLARAVRLGVQFLLVELFVPGGTLIVLTLLLAGRFAPVRLAWLAAC